MEGLDGCAAGAAGVGRGHTVGRERSRGSGHGADAHSVGGMELWRGGAPAGAVELGRGSTWRGLGVRSAAQGVGRGSMRCAQVARGLSSKRKRTRKLKLGEFELNFEFKFKFEIHTNSPKNGVLHYI